MKESNLVVPVEVLNQHAVALGKTGTGKSSAIRHVVEYWLDHNERVVVFDPKGDWWGLKKAGDGHSGYNAVMFGDFKEPKATDIQINPQSGKLVGELVATGNRPLVIGMRGWMPSAQAKFWIDFASTIFNSNQVGGLKIVIDEVQNVAPKERTGFGEENMALHWTKRLLSEGRGLGLTIFCGSQRPQSVHNGVLTQCETLIAMRLIHDADCTAVENWMKRTRDKATRADIMTSIPTQERGQAWVWCPEVGFGPKQIRFPMFKTFDSFAPPQSQKKIVGGWEAVNLEEIKGKFSRVIEETKLNDPAELRKKNSELSREIERLKKEKPMAPAPDPEKIPCLTDHERTRLTKLIDQFGSLYAEAETLVTRTHDLSKATNEARAEMEFFKSLLEGKLPTRPLVTPQRAAPATSIRVSPVASVVRPFRSQSPTPSDGEIKLGKAARAILTAAIQRHPKRSSKSQLAVISGYSVNSSTFSNSLTDLRKSGLIEGTGDSIGVTDDGVAHLPEVPPLPSGEELLRYWCGQLGLAERTLLQVISANPSGIDKEALSAETGYSSNSSSFSNALTTLRTLELITRQWPIQPTGELL